MFLPVKCLYHQVDKSQEEEFSGSQRRGRIYLQKFVQTCPNLSILVQARPNVSRLVQACPNLSGLVQTRPNVSRLVQARDDDESSEELDGSLALIQTLETAAVLDLKWSCQTHSLEDGREVPILASGKTCLIE